MLPQPRNPNGDFQLCQASKLKRSMCYVVEKYTAPPLSDAMTDLIPKPMQQQAATLCSTSYSVSQIVRLINCLHLSKN